MNEKNTGNQEFLKSVIILQISLELPNIFCKKNDFFVV